MHSRLSFILLPIRTWFLLCLEIISRVFWCTCRMKEKVWMTQVETIWLLRPVSNALLVLGGCGDLWNAKGSLREVIQLQSWRTNTGTQPCAHALLYSLWDSLIIKCSGFSCPKKAESKYILYTSFWILYKLQYLSKDCLAVGAARAWPTQTESQRQPHSWPHCLGAAPHQVHLPGPELALGRRIWTTVT